MHVDLLTLYFLAIGTLLASAGMTYWEHRAHPKRSKELRVFSAAYVTLALGCGAVLLRGHFPGASGSAVSNLIILGGYLLVLHGAAIWNGRRYALFSFGILALSAVTWAVAGSAGQAVMWRFVTAFPIAMVSGLTARELFRSDAAKAVQSRHVAVAVTGVHALLYLFRACILPWLVAPMGDGFLSIASKITMYEGVLYSVLLPMAVLRLVREESHGELLRDSQTDYLTRLGNRRWFFEAGERLVLTHLSSEARNRPMSLMVFDLDHFKAINDQFGHKTGDEVLRAFADTALAMVPSGAILARIGGEEFAALFPGYDTFKGKELGESIASRFAETMSSRLADRRIEATVSIGLAQFGDELLSLADLLAAADRALYSAKSLGRNRLEVAQSLQALRLPEDELSNTSSFS
ncbi:GGDEF domain-containing protein [Robbsia sp. KACC 23696]|uniref:GGDEF domain-containing protein n=1 Tax=Robbsia sp. KACC 23696 TaxID=3149231 RepID=UPI00325A7105